ncbi:MAG: hypothetical protein WEA24_04565 [Gemmatimonadota bacterium]
MDELSNRLRAARREAVPGRDLWPDVARRIDRAGGMRWQRAATAVLLFGAGALAGTLLERTGGGRESAPADAVSASPLHTAAAVQKAGSDYLAALARLRDVAATNEAFRMQGYEAALNVVAVTAQEVTAVLEMNVYEALVGPAHTARAAASRRVMLLTGGGDE